MQRSAANRNQASKGQGAVTDKPVGVGLSAVEATIAKLVEQGILAKPDAKPYGVKHSYDPSVDMLTIVEIVRRHTGDAKWMANLVAMLNPLLVVEEAVETEAKDAMGEEL